MYVSYCIHHRDVTSCSLVTLTTRTQLVAGSVVYWLGCHTPHDSGSRIQFSAMTLPGYFWDRWPSLAGKLSWDITTTQLKSALHKSSTSFRWSKGGNVTAARWQVTLCDPIWHVISCSSEVIHTNFYINCTYNALFGRLYVLLNVHCVSMTCDAGTRYRLLILSTDGATLDEISITVNQLQSPLLMSCFVITNHNHVRHHSHFITTFEEALTVCLSVCLSVWGRAVQLGF